MVRLRIKRDTEWGEYILQWVEDRCVDEGKSYYTGGTSPEHAQDAVFTAISMIREARQWGTDIEFNEDKKTISLISKYAPGFLLEETRRVIRG